LGTKKFWKSGLILKVTRVRAQEDVIEDAMDELGMKNFTEESAKLSDNGPMNEDHTAKEACSLGCT
jgi:hypothetical protein